MNTYLKVFHWTPRIICILAIVFISLFAILGGENTNMTSWQQLSDLFMGLLPTLGLIIVLFVAWNWEKNGGIIFLLIGLIFSPLIYLHNYNMTESVWYGLETVLIINFPFILVGILFIVSHYMKKKHL